MYHQGLAESVDQKLFRRELCGNTGSSSTRGLYGSRVWVDNLDITNELYGHTGCVNALSWSRSGHLLASGSDDTMINIHTTTPDFAFNTAIDTGHTANIFSVKFMPFSNDSKIVSCAGDWEVRIFDIEYAPTSAPSQTPRASISPQARTRYQPHRYGTSFNSNPKPAKLYTAGEASAKVYTSHTDRVKRIVTENSPYLFLTCSEDGEVRQFDLRQPSAYYSRGSSSSESRSRASLPRHTFGGIDVLAGGGDSDDRNPPLISYKKQRIELNTISCSTGQPHYIALGGAHTHCFLHDRRMLGRDTSTEAGRPSSYRDSELSAATRCVRRFALPHRNSKGSGTWARENCHITACKISDANPDEIVVSWSGENIYLFDINKSPEVPGFPEAKANTKTSGEGRVDTEKHRKDKGKGKKTEDSSRSSSEQAGNSESGKKRKRSGDAFSREDHDRALALLESELDDNVSMSSLQDDMEDFNPDLYGKSESAEPEVPGQSVLRISALLDDLRKNLFGSQTVEDDDNGRETDEKPWSSVVRLAKVSLQRMDEVIRKHREMYGHQETISRDGFMRARTRRFVQAAGALSHALGGRLRGKAPVDRVFAQKHFSQIDGNPGRDDNWSLGVKLHTEELGWRYSFIQLIIEYIKHGPGSIGPLAIRKGFGSDIMAEGDELAERAQEKLFNSMEQWMDDVANSTAFHDIDEPALILAQGGEPEIWRRFRQLIEGSGADDEILEEEKAFWGVKVARILLSTEGEEIDTDLVYVVFDQPEEEEDDDDELKMAMPVSLRRRLERAESEEEGLMDIGEYFGFLERHGHHGDNDDTGDEPEEDEEEEDDGELDDMSEEGGDDDDEDDIGESDEDEDEDENGDDDEDNDEAGRPAPHYRRLKRRAERLEAHAPIWNHIKSYSGHCNVQTVKDVNFYGLNDEYVVSGSDCGNLFIWDKKTSKLVQLLHGDEDTVNVVVGHPYEPCLAVSGIDNTVKIFSPDQAAQAEFFGKERAHGPRRYTDMDSSGDEQDSKERGSRRRLHDEYQIRSQNEVRREKGVHEALLARGLLESLAARLRRGEEGQDISGTIASGNGCVVS
ncbi:WD domain-containing protein [Peziza echinospora]|nr:WD domain-containing protein [Peziza echinospora]